MKSFTKWPAGTFGSFPVYKLFTTRSASPSKHTLQKPSSGAKIAALRAAIISKISTDVGMGTFLDKAANNRPSLLQMSTPMPPACSSSNTALSKFTFTEPSSEGYHRTGPTLVWDSFRCFPCWNSCNRVKADWASFETSKAGSLCLSLFLRIHINHAIMANPSKLFPSA